LRRRVEFGAEYVGGSEVGDKFFARSLFPLILHAVSRS
jgi:hypothetical protein